MTEKPKFAEQAPFTAGSDSHSLNTQNAKKVYADIIDLSHHQSATRPHMSLHDRAAQFAPFAALSGYDDMVTETARLTDTEIELSDSEIEIELSDSEIEIINSVIAEIASLTENGAHPTVSVTHFIPDPHKHGGRYEPFTGVVKRVDPIKKQLIFYGSDSTEDKTVPTIDVDLAKVIHIAVISDRP